MPGNGAGPEQLDAAGAEAAERTARALQLGQAVVLPTDTVYGVAVLLSTNGAPEILSRLKARSAEQALAVLVGSIDQARSLTEPPSAAAARLMAAFWPGPVTLVLRRRPELAGLSLGGGSDTIGLRWPDHALIRELAARLGPLVTTSANLHGQPTPSSAAEAAGALAGPVGAVVDGGVLAGLPSTVIDCTTDLPAVLREGAVSAEQVRLVVEAGA